MFDGRQPGGPFHAHHLRNGSSPVGIASASLDRSFKKFDSLALTGGNTGLYGELISF